MKNKKSAIKDTWYDIASSVFAFIFILSVINNVKDFAASGIKNAPNSYALIVALIVIAYSWYRAKQLSILAIVTLTGIVTALSIWGFGLHQWLK